MNLSRPEDRYRTRLPELAKGDVEGLEKAHQSYGNSWKKRGGANAFFMLCRKFDRIELQVEKHHFDVFAAAAADVREEGILDDIRDLRRYLLLVEAEIRQRQSEVPFRPEDPNGPELSP